MILGVGPSERCSKFSAIWAQILWAFGRPFILSFLCFPSANHIHSFDPTHYHLKRCFCWGGGYVIYIYLQYEYRINESMNTRWQGLVLENCRVDLVGLSSCLEDLDPLRMNTYEDVK